MFVRIKSTPNSPRKSVQIVASVRDGDKVRQKIIRHIGIATDADELKALREIAEVSKAKLEADHQASLFPPETVAQQMLDAKAAAQADKPLMVDVKQLQEEQRVVMGIHEAYGEVYRQLGLDRVLSRHRYRASHEVLRHCVLARIANPDSKRRSVMMLEQDFGIRVPLEKVYRMMDQLDDQPIKRLKDIVCQHTLSLLSGPLTVLFFDCTTLYFESFTADALKQNGYSKDNKFNQPQVLLALLVSDAGLPVGYEVFPGATFEGHTLIPVMREMKARYALERMVCVADRGLLSRDNLKALEEAGAYYVVGAKLKQLPQSMRARVLDKSHYRPLPSETANRPAEEQSVSSVFEFLHQKRRWVVSWCPGRAAKDRHDRHNTIERLIQKFGRELNSGAGKPVNPKTLLNNYGYKRFLTLTGNTTAGMDQRKVEEAALWDGLHGVVTNLPDDQAAHEVLAHYRGLWQVEESFRITKHDLKVRPIYHWTPSRIRAHIAIAFMSFACVRHLMYRVRLQHRPVSAAVIRNALVNVQQSVLRDKRSHHRYVLPSTPSPEASKIYQVLGIKPTTTPYQLD